MANNGDATLISQTTSTTAYAGVECVQRRGTHHGLSYTATSRPSLADVQEFLDERSRIIDSRLAQVGVRVPVVKADSPKAHALLATVCCYGASADAQNAAYFRYNREGLLHSAQHYEKMFEALLVKYAGDGIPNSKARGNPELLQDAIMSSEKPNWPPGNMLTSRVNDLWDVPDPALLLDHTFKREEIF